MAKDKYQQILYATIDLLEKKHHCSIRAADIAKEAGIAPGTLYLYFANLEEIIIEALKLTNDILIQQLFINTTPEVSYLENMGTLQYNIKHAMEDGLKYYKVLKSGFTNMNSEENMKLLTQMGERIFLGYIDVFRWARQKRELPEGLNEYLVCLAMSGSIEILMQKLALTGETETVLEKTEQVFRCYESFGNFYGGEEDETK